MLMRQNLGGIQSKGRRARTSPPVLEQGGTSMTLEQLHAELDEMTGDDTEAVILISISEGAIVFRAFGDKELVREALDELIDDYESNPPPEVYAH